MDIISSLAKRSKLSEIYIQELWNEVSKKLIQQGLLETDKRFNVYLLTNIKRQIKINETSITLKRFK